MSHAYGISKATLNSRFGVRLGNLTSGVQNIVLQASE